MLKKLCIESTNAQLIGRRFVVTSPFGSITFEHIFHPDIEDEIDSSDELETTRLLDLLLIPDVFRPIFRLEFQQGRAGFARLDREGYALWIVCGDKREFYTLYCTHPKVTYRTTDSPVPLMRSGLCA